MKHCSIVEDLLPLYEEGLVQDDTAKWIQQHLQTCEKCRSLAEMNGFAIEKPEPHTSPFKTIRKTQVKLSIYQLLFVVLSFIFAMNTSLFNESFGFILSYFVLGLITYYFYRSWIITLALAAVPIYIWSIIDTVSSFDSWQLFRLHQIDIGYTSAFESIWILLFSGLIPTLLHIIFSVLGANAAQLLIKFLHTEESP